MSVASRRGFGHQATYGLRVSALLAAFAGSACISIDLVPQKDDELDAGQEDSGQAETDAGQEDSGQDDAGHDAGETSIACVDRGKYYLDAAEVRGLSKTCDGQLVCVDDECVPASACTQGVTGECLFQPDGAHGELVSAKIAGDYVYWIEAGSYDSRGNYQDNGSIARAKVGTWQREELATSLPFDSTFPSSMMLDLKVEGDLVFAQFLITDGHWLTYRVSSSPGGQPVVRDPQLDEVAISSTCVHAGQQFWTDGESAYRRSLSEPDKIEQLATGIGFGEYRVTMTCVATEGFVVLSIGSAPILVPTDGSGMRLLSPATIGIGFHEGMLVVVDRPWLATAPVDVNTVSLDWTRVAGGSNTIYDPVVSQDYAYWAAPATNRKRNVVVRGKLDGSGIQEVVAERFDIFRPSDEEWEPMAAFSVGEAGVVWLGGAPDNYIHFAALPEPDR